MQVKVAQWCPPLCDPKESVAGLGWRSELESGYSGPVCRISTLGFMLRGTGNQRKI